MSQQLYFRFFSEKRIKKACKHGHPLTPDNERWAMRRGQMQRECKQCMKERSKGLR